MSRRDMTSRLYRLSNGQVVKLYHLERSDATVSGLSIVGYFILLAILAYVII